MCLMQLDSFSINALKSWSTWSVPGVYVLYLDIILLQQQSSLNSKKSQMYYV